MNGLDSLGYNPGRPSIQFVENDDTVRGTLALNLRAEGYEVEMAVHGQRRRP